MNILTQVLKNHSPKKIVVHTILPHNSMGFYFIFFYFFSYFFILTRVFNPMVGFLKVRPTSFYKNQS